MSFWNAFGSEEPSQTGQIIDDVRYHLTKLLESEAALVDCDDRLTEINRSNLRFGIEDVQLLSASLDHAQLALRLETWIRNFEPRLHKVSVEMTGRKAGENALTFTIIARLGKEYGEQELVFDSKIALCDLTSSLEEENYD